MDTSGDNPELEQLFNEVLRKEHPDIGKSGSVDSLPESIESLPEVVPSASRSEGSIGGVAAGVDSGDSPELQALFDDVKGGRLYQVEKIKEIFKVPDDSLSEVVKLWEINDPQVDRLKELLEGEVDLKELLAVWEGIKHPQVEKVKEIIRMSLVTSAPPPAPVVEEEVVVEDKRAESEVNPLAGMSDREAKMFSRVGQLTRQFHDMLRELGFDKSLESVSSAIPDAKDRLHYIANMTESAAAKVLDAADSIQPLQNELESQSGELVAAWQMVFANKMSTEEFKALAETTLKYLQEVPNKTSKTNDQVMEIILAQDFQDLTGQVIKKILDMVQSLEKGLVEFLMAYSPESLHKKDSGSLENGPVIDTKDPEVVTNQQQVDDLLESLGF